MEASVRETGSPCLEACSEMLELYEASSITQLSGRDRLGSGCATCTVVPCQLLV